MDAWESIERELVDVKTNSWTSILQIYGAIKSLVYISEVLPLSILSQVVQPKRKNINSKDIKKLQLILAELWLLIQKDSERIAAGIYPSTVLKPELSFGHLGQIFRIWIDGYREQLQRNRKNRKVDLDIEDLEALRDVPDYYRQHNSYSGNGFIDRKAASLYEHQMELLFIGAMDAMRRLILAPLKKAFRYSEGEGLRFLEIGCGEGRMTRFIKIAFPKAKIVVLDASSVYLKEAQKNLMKYRRIDFIQGDALDLPFKNCHFDVVYSSFILHEMPIDKRRRVLVEAYRVLNKKGLLGIVDLIQFDDCREMNWVLEQPWLVKEKPHIKEYASNSTSGLFQHLGLEQITIERGFLGKSVIGLKAID